MVQTTLYSNTNFSYTTNIGLLPPAAYIEYTLTLSWQMVLQAKRVFLSLSSDAVQYLTRREYGSQATVMMMMKVLYVSFPSVPEGTSY